MHITQSEFLPGTYRGMREGFCEGGSLRYVELNLIPERSSNQHAKFRRIFKRGERNNMLLVEGMNFIGEKILNFDLRWVERAIRNRVIDKGVDISSISGPSECKCQFGSRGHACTYSAHISNNLLLSPFHVAITLLGISSDNYSVRRSYSNADRHAPTPRQPRRGNPRRLRCDHRAPPYPWSSEASSFKAGIARSGAYNRSLTPFGFQNEERNYWQDPDIYFKMSPFSYADKIKTPLLMIHGEADKNQGTFPIQSERFFDALKGHGATVRLVFLPLEAHGYAARESLEHMLWEMDNWLDTYVKNPAPAKATAEQESAR
jgi:hypothetical protein